MIFPNLELEDTVQFGDRTRLNAMKSFITQDEAAITLVEIEPDVATGFIDVTGSSSEDWFLDWEYTGVTSATQTVKCRITTDGSPITVSKTLETVIAADDRLFSDDNQLTQQESDILKWVPAGRNSFLNIHRRAQELIIAFLDEQGYTDVDGAPYTKEDIIDLNEVSQWSKALALSLIFQSQSNAIDDVFDRKAKFYETEVLTHRHRSILRIDTNNDGTVDLGEHLPFKTLDIIRR
jgi:hypothetical protein